MAKSFSLKWKTSPTSSSSSSSYLPLLTHPCSVTAIILSQKPQPWLSSTPTKPFSSFFFQYQHPFCQLRRRTSIASASCRRRDSIVRAFRNRNRFNFSSGDEDNEDDFDVDDDDDDFGRKRRRRKRAWLSDNPPASETDQGPGIVEEFIDSLWIFKVFGSYGWMLPVIIISLLLATGPKAFLMALALPIAQSAISLAFKKVWGTTKDSLRNKAKTRKKQRGSTASNFELEEEEEEEESQGTRKATRVYPSWIAKDDVSVNKDSPDTSNFGGWDELDKTMEFDMGSLKRSARTARLGQTRREKSKFSKRERKGDAPLLLRLLIAVFPFLGSWTKML